MGIATATASGIITTATANQVLADTGQLSRGYYNVETFFRGNVGQEMLWQHRNAANDATLIGLTLQCVSGWHPPFVLKTYYLNANERIRVLARAAVPTGKESEVLIATYYFGDQVPLPVV